MSESQVPRIIITTAAREFIESGIQVLETAYTQQRQMIGILTFPISIEQMGEPNSRRTSAAGGGLVSLGLIEEDRLESELISNMAQRKIAVRLPKDMMDSSEVTIDFERELFFK